jgi:hypothetical protein
MSSDAVVVFERKRRRRRRRRRRKLITVPSRVRQRKKSPRY